MIEMKQSQQDISELNQQHLFALLETMFNEINQTNQISVMIGLISASTDSSLYWALSFSSCDILAQWIGLNGSEKYAFQIIVSLCSACAVSSIDIYAAKGMVEQAQHIFNRRKILPSHFSFLMKMLGLFLIINSFAVVGPAGLIYQQYATNASKATYLAIAESMTNLLAGSFFMLNMAEEIKKAFLANNLSREEHKQKVLVFIESIVKYLTSLDEVEYTSTMTKIYASLQKKDLEGVLSQLDIHSSDNLSDITRESNEENFMENGLLSQHINSSLTLQKKIDWQAIKHTVLSLLPSFLPAVFAMINIGWLYFLVGVSYVLDLIPTSNTGPLRDFRYTSASCFATMYGSIAFYSGLTLANNLFMTKREGLTPKNIASNSLILILSLLASLIVIVLVDQTVNQGKNYLYYGAFLSTLMINANAIYHIDLRELKVDFLYDFNMLLANAESFIFPDRDNSLSNAKTFFPSKEELERRVYSLKQQITFSPERDLKTLASSISSIKIK